MNGDGHDGHVGACRRGKGAAEKLADLANLIECTLGKEHQGLAGGRELPHAPRVRSGQLVLFAQAPLCPHCGVVTGAKIVEFGDQSIA